MTATFSTIISLSVTIFDANLQVKNSLQTLKYKRLVGYNVKMQPTC